MVDKVARWLGWTSKNEYSTLEAHCELLRNRIIEQNAQIDYMRSSLAKSEDHVRYLENLIFQEHGLITQDGTQVPQEDNLRPINTKPRSIFQTMRAMQRDDALRARSSKAESPIPEGLPRA